MVNTNGSNAVALNAAAKPAQAGLLTDNGTALASHTYSVASVGANPVLAITGPATWSAGKPTTVTWSVRTAGQACARGVQVLLNGGQVGGSGALTGGSATIGAVSWPRGTRVSLTLRDVCNNAIVSAPFTTVIQ